MQKINKEKIDLLVLSDRYPPHSVGGAELSLHSVVRRIPKCRKILVISVYPDSNSEGDYTHEGVSIKQVKAYPNFPFHSFSPRVYNILQKNKWLSKGYTKLIISRYKHLFTLFSDLDSKDISSIIKYGCDELIFEQACSIKDLKSICEHYDIETLHADNLRSIGLSQHINAKSKIFTIRDNRFHECTIKSNYSDLEANLIMNNHDYRLSLLDTADTVIVTSEHLLSNLQRVKPNVNYLKIPNPADDINQVNEIVKNVEEQEGFNIVIVGMLNENKGQVQLIKAIKKEIKKYPEIKIHLVGRGDRIAKRINEIAIEAGIRDQIIMHGYLSREETYRKIKSSQIVLLPTMWEEPFGRVPLEAGLLSKPVIAFSAGGLKETIIHNQTGLLVSKGDFQKMFQYIMLLKNDEKLRDEMGLKAKNHILKNYDARNISHEYFKAWQI